MFYRKAWMEERLLKKILRKEHNQVLLKPKVCLRITKCLKDIMPLDNSHIPIEIRDQESDGNVIIEFSDDTFLFFGGITKDGRWLDIQVNLDIYDNDRSKFIKIHQNFSK